MQHLAKVVIGVIVTCGSAYLAIGGDSSGPLERPKSAAAGLALDRYEKAVKDADEIHRQAVRRATDVLIDHLKPARAGAMKTGNLADATAIDNLLKRLEQEVTKDSSPLAASAPASQSRALSASLAGTTWVFEGSSQTMTFNRDGTISRTDGFSEGSWAAVDGHSVIILYANDVVDRLHFNDSLTGYHGEGSAPQNKFKGNLQNTN